MTGPVLTTVVTTIPAAKRNILDQNPLGAAKGRRDFDVQILHVSLYKVELCAPELQARNGWLMSQGVPRTDFCDGSKLRCTM